MVYEDGLAFAFLDSRPLFPGHTLLIPKQHFETLDDLPADSAGAFFQTVQLLSRAVERGVHADGTFVAINNRVSQSVPHLHVHIVPRRKKDGLRGFFWPRHPYPDEATMQQVRDAIRGAFEQPSV